VLNTKVTDGISGSSLATNQITLPAGTFRIRATAPGYRVDNHQLRLRNITDSTTDLLGTTVKSANGTQNVTTATLIGQITIAGAKAFELQHICGDTQASDGMGSPGSFSVGEIYAEIEITKV
jgi:hypothetical protein